MKDGTAAETMPRRAKSLLQPSHASHLDILIFSSGISGPVILKLALGVEFSILTFKKASKQASKQKDKVCFFVFIVVSSPVL